MRIPAIIFVVLVAAALFSQTPAQRNGIDPSTIPYAPSIALDTTGAFEELGRAIRVELASRRIRNAVSGVKVYDITAKRDVFAHRASEPLTPASTMKLFTSSAAMGLFGPHFHITTDILCDTLIHGEVHGNVYLKGHGDPTFSANDLDSLVDALKRRGIKQITGDIVGDASFFDDVVDRSKYSGDGEMVEALPPISALTINRNAIMVVAHAGARGERVRVQTVPHVPCIALSSSAMSVAPRKRLRLKRRKHSAWYGESPTIVRSMYVLSASFHHSKRRAVSGLRYSVGRSAGGKQTVMLSGSLVVGGISSRQVELANPALAAASMLAYRLKTNGIGVDGSAMTGETPSGAVLLAAKQTPLVDICAMLNKHSDNFAAELLFKMIGALYCAMPSSATSTADSSVKYIHTFLASCNINAAHCAFHDGSGLSRHAAITADTKVALLNIIHSRDTLFPAFYNTLAIGGIDGTIRGRMRGTFAENNVHAKTGTLNNVTALTGYVTTRDGELWAFDITMNSARVHIGRDVQDRIVEKLAAFSYRTP